MDDSKLIDADCTTINQDGQFVQINAYRSSDRRETVVLEIMNGDAEDSSKALVGGITLDMDQVSDLLEIIKRFHGLVRH